MKQLIAVIIHIMLDDNEENEKRKEKSIKCNKKKVSKR